MHSGVAVGIRFASVGIDDDFVEDDFVLLGFFACFKNFRVHIPFDLVWIVDSDFARFVDWVGDFVDDVLFEEIKVQLFLPLRVEGETTYLAFHFSGLGSVPVILGSSSSKLDDVISGFQFAGEFAEMIVCEGHGIAGLMRDDDGIGVEVEDLFGG